MYAAADNDVLPPSAARGLADDRLHVVATIQAEQARLHADAVLTESSHAQCDRLGDRLRVPVPWDPVRVEADHEDPGFRSGGVHS